MRANARTPAKNGTTLVSLASENPAGETLALRPQGTLSSSFRRTPVRDVIEAIYEVDQSPIGKTSRSTPATYIKVFDEIRALFAQMPLARMRGYTASRFSFNTEGGRCETCTGQGMIKVEMNFLPTTWLPCPDCHGKRYNAATLEVLFNDRSIGQVMEMTLAEAAEFFRNNPKIHRPLQLLCDTGLGYLQLGQASPTLSGGEAQRLKLVAELARGTGRSETARLRRRDQKSMLYLLEEPTIGLHMCDVQKLLEVLHRLVDDGATVIVIEHNLDLIAEADCIIDIGPEAGPAGGEIVACGTPEEVANSKRSRTAPFLKEHLQSGKAAERPSPTNGTPKRRTALLAR
jgi:excinuclease ABC subunit A